MKNPTVENQERSEDQKLAAQKPEDQKSNLKPSERVLTNINWVQEILKFLPPRTVMTNYSQVSRTFNAAYKKLIDTPDKKTAFYNRLYTEEKEKIHEPLVQLNALVPSNFGRAQTIMTVGEFPGVIDDFILNPHTIKLENPEDIQHAQHVTNELIRKTRGKLGMSCLDNSAPSMMVTLINFIIGGMLLCSGIIESNPLYCEISTPFFFFALLTLIYMCRKYKRIQTLNKAAESLAGPLITYGTFLERLNQHTDSSIRQPLLLEQGEQDDRACPTSP